MSINPPIRAEPLLILVRGLPGSGKSTLAESLCIDYDARWYEADDFFTDGNGNYQFNPGMLGLAHDTCYSRTLNALQQGYNVVVANTFTTRGELDRYVRLGYNTLVLKCVGEYGSVHNVPSETITRMKQRWQNYEGEIEVSAYRSKLPCELEIREDDC